MAEPGLSPKQRAALTALLAGQTQAEAAAAAHVAPKTLWRWRREPGFVAELRAEQAAILDAAVAALTGLSRPAVEALGAVIDDPEARPGEKIRAAAVILENLLALKANVDFEARLIALENERRTDDGER